MTRADLLASALDDLLSVSPDVEAAAVVSADGLPMASALPPHVEEDRLAAMSAALLTLGERAASGLDKGRLSQVFVQGDEGNIVLMAAGPHAVLVAMASKEAKVGLVLFEMRGVAVRIAEVMESAPEAAPAEEASAQQGTPEGPVWQPAPQWQTETPSEGPQDAPAATPSEWNTETPDTQTYSTWQ